MPLRLRRVVLHEVGPFQDLDLTLPDGRDPERADLHLLVGPNGAGKSTVLSAIAQCFSGSADTGYFGRRRTEAARVELDLGDVHLGLTSPADRSPRTLDDLRLADRPVHRGVALEAMFAAVDDSARRTPFAVFSYGGHRIVAHGALAGIAELTSNPLAGATSARAATGEFAQWVANTVAREALSARDGDPARAAARRAALTRVEQAMAEVVGEPVRLRLADDPFRVVVKVGDAEEVPLARLADGLQSLLSWIGDLLMRMDRVKWEGDPAVTDRPFLLLLDEVEVHLHPAWQRRRSGTWRRSGCSGRGGCPESPCRTSSPPRRIGSAGAAPSSPPSSRRSCGSSRAGWRRPRDRLRPGTRTGAPRDPRRGVVGGVRGVPRGGPALRFQWRSFDGVPVNQRILPHLLAMTAGHCAYCDGYPLDVTGRPTIDHFRPKSTFPALVYRWDNLFPACERCQAEKRDRWDEALLRPDEPGYAFERYFLCDVASGRIEPNPAADDRDQARARRTIDLFGLNAGGRPRERARWLQGRAEIDGDLAPYRFLA